MESKEIAVAVLGIVAAVIGLVTAYIARTKRHEVKIYTTGHQPAQDRHTEHVADAVRRDIVRSEKLPVVPAQAQSQEGDLLFQTMVTCSLPKKLLEHDYDWVQGELTITQQLLSCRSADRTVLSLSSDQVRFGLIRVGAMNTWAAEPFILLELANKNTVLLKFADQEMRDAAMRAVRTMAKRNEYQWG